MAKTTNRKPKTKKDLDNQFFSCVAKRTRSRTEVYITKVAKELKKCKNREFCDYDDEFESKSGFSSDVEVTEISTEDDNDVVEIAFEDLKIAVQEKRKGKVFDMVDDDEESDDWFKKKVAEEEKNEIFDDAEDDGVYEIDKHEMGFDLKRGEKSGQESVPINVCKSQYFEAGESSSVSKTKNVKNGGGFAMSGADFYLSSPSTASADHYSSASTATDMDDSDYHVGTSSEPESDCKSSSFVDEDDEEEEELPRRKRRSKAKAYDDDDEDDDDYDEEEEEEEENRQQKKRSKTARRKAYVVDDDEEEEENSRRKKRFKAAPKKASDNDDDDDGEENDKPQHKKRFKAAPRKLYNDDEEEEEEKLQRKNKFEAAIENASDETTLSDDILIQKDVKSEPIISDECIIVEETESVKLAQSCSNNSLNDESPIQRKPQLIDSDVGIRVSGDHEKAQVIVKFESHGSLMQRNTRLDSDIEVIGESLVENVQLNNIGVVETNNVDAEKEIESEKIDETVGSCNNNDDNHINDEGGADVEIGVVQIEQVDVEAKKVESEKLDETVGSCNNNNKTSVDIVVSGSGEKTEVPSVESVIEKKVQTMPSVESVAEKKILKMPSLDENGASEKKTQKMPSVESVTEKKIQKTPSLDANGMIEKNTQKMPSVESVTEKKIQKMPSLDVNRGKESVKSADLNEKNVEFGLRKMNVGKKNDGRKIRESGAYKIARRFHEKRKSVKCDQKIEQAPETSVSVQRKKRPASTEVDETVRPQKKVQKISETNDLGKMESDKKNDVLDNGQSQNGATTVKEGKRSAEIIGAEPASTTELESSNVDSGSLEHEVMAEDEKRSEEIDSEAPKARRGVKSSDGACELLLNAILMNEQNGAEKKRFNTEYDPVNLAKRDNVLTLDQLKFTFGVPKQIPVEKTPEELVLDSMWAELDFALMDQDMDDFVSPNEEGVTQRSAECGSDSGCSNGDHVLRLDEEIGLICIRCSFIQVEIRHNPTEVVQAPKNSRVTRKKLEFDEEVLDDLEELQFQTPGAKASSSCNRREGTVWDTIPGVKSSMYQHQQEGFEFIWKNLEGTLSLDQLKNSESKVGGCIISHAPGTGKTRLTIVFLQTYLEIFPNSRPVIIAPASMLLTWEEEFRKWGVSVPFHNLNNLDQSAGKDDFAQIHIADVNQRGRASTDILRLAKLLLWCKHKSILGISYSLYEKLVGDHKRKHGASVKKEVQEFRRVLLEYPGLLVLDEGHTPRNERSRIWKALTKVETQRRIILSGTPFQNNFVELYNIFCLVRPEFANQIPRSLKKFCQTRSLIPKRKVGEAESSVPTEHPADHAIEELKVIIAPFVHVHKGSILKESLPGLKDCVIVLNHANEIQKHIIDTIDCGRNTFEYEHTLALSTAHPSLALQVPHVINNEESGANRSLLQEIRLNPNEGSKTSFLIKLVRLSEAMNEKVLVFSQFLQPLVLVKEQLRSVMNWTEGRELLVMQGKLDQGRRQCLINVFNDPDSQAKVLLASTKACSEGINLVGASRVVLLDVVWNPSVERQAISRAYRLGQKKVVHTYHLIMLGTAEWDKFCKQSEKDRLSELVFSTTEKVNEKQKICLGSEDRILEKMISHENLNGLIAKIIYQPKETKLIETFC